MNGTHQADDPFLQQPGEDVVSSFTAAGLFHDNGNQIEQSACGRVQISLKIIITFIISLSP